MQKLVLAMVALASAPIMIGAKPAPLTGIWGAPGAALTLTATGGQLQQDCAHATLGPVTPDSKGRFKVTGKIEPYAVGPQAANKPPVPISATFSGQIGEGKLELTITPKGRKAEHYSLTEARRIKIIRCL